MKLRGAAFPRQARLTRSAEFRWVLAAGCRAGSRHLVLVAKPNAQAAPRLGLAISKRHAPHAVDRNRIKRLVRESFRRRRAELSGLDIVALARAGAGEADNRILLRQLERLWGELVSRCAP